MNQLWIQRIQTNPLFEAKQCFENIHVCIHMYLAATSVWFRDHNDILPKCSITVPHFFCKPIHQFIIMSTGVAFFIFRHFPHTDFALHFTGWLQKTRPSMTTVSKEASGPFLISDKHRMKNPKPKPTRVEVSTSNQRPRSGS